MCEHNSTIIGKTLAARIRHVVEISHWSLVDGVEPIVELFNRCEWIGLR